MWVASKYGYYSIKYDEADQVYHIRGRSKRDIENIISAAGLSQKVQTWPNADYRYRALVSREEYTRVMTALSESVDYPNFKEEITRTLDQQDKIPAYFILWMEIREYQDKSPVK